MSKSSEHSGHPGPVPNRWLKCPRKSNGLIVDKFLVFKTPLSSRFDKQVPPQYRFPPNMILGEKPYKDKMGLWIDLTNTSRFYDEREVSKHCKYVKLECRGHGETPNENQTTFFIKLVEKFISQNPLALIGVHCTHGFNRSGFLICSYLITKLDFSVDGALVSFRNARPPGIYKEDYIKELYRLYASEEDAIPAPDLPDWCYDSDDAEDDTNEVTATGEQSTGKRGNKEVQFMEGVNGVIHLRTQPEVHNLQLLIKKMCGWDKKDFPGSQPVSMDRDNISLLKEHPYRVSWKADGVRYMMLITKGNKVYFFDRDNNVFTVRGFLFPRFKSSEAYLENTLVDGEMVIDQVNGEAIPRYLIYDIVHCNGEDVRSRRFEPDRLRLIHEEIIQPRHDAIKKGKINKEAEPFSIRQKHFWHITKAASLLGEKFSKMLSHEPDGLIFQPSWEPYTPGRCPMVLKWKPATLNSVDFRLKIKVDDQLGCIRQKVGLLYVGNLSEPFDQIKYTKKLAELDNKIIECTNENGKWVFLRERTDKSFPNGLATAQGVCKSIRSPVTKEDLLNFIQYQRYNDDNELMAPPRMEPPRMHAPPAKRVHH